MQTKFVTGFSILGLCIAGSTAAFAQITEPVPSPAPAPTAPALRSVTGKWKCGNGAQLTATISGGGLGVNGTIRVSGGGAPTPSTVKYTVKPGATNGITVTTTARDCRRGGYFTMEINMSNGTRQVKYLDMDTATLHEIQIPG
jgi:hypothetical protein